MQRFIIFFLVYSPFLCFSQKEEGQVIEEIVITNKPSNICELQLELSSERIQNKLATDIGQLMLLFPGVQLKNYGSLGGLKTVGFRSLGAGHTSIVQDNTAFSVTQSGQTDLSQLPSDFVRSIELISLASTSTQLPIQSKLTGNVISITTRHSISLKDSSWGTFGIQAGSFDQYNAQLFLGHNFKKWRVSLSAKARTAQGEYSYRFINGNTTETRTRRNADLRDDFGQLSIYYSPTKEHTFSFFANGNQYNKGLPGAVVFYNESADQRLNGNQLATGLKHQFNSAKWNINSAINFQQSYLKYTDSSYLNSLGYLIQQFHSLQIDGQSQLSYSWTKSKLLFGTELRSEQLNSPNLIADVMRNTWESVIGFSSSLFGNFSAQLGIQSISDQTTTNLYNSFNVLPAVDFNSKINEAFSYGFGYHYTVRQPTFNERYYQQIGNTNLKPEKAHIATVRIGHTVQIKKWTFQTLAQPFYTQALNKILAIPTKNLFIWSIQNIGKSDALGLELTHQSKRRFAKSSLALSLNYTFQYTRDLSNPESTSYKDILSYSPLNTGTAELRVQRKVWSFFTLLSYQGQRYSLNENIPQNSLDSYFLIDIGGSYTKTLTAARSISVQGTLNNLTNNYYSYIRYFIMPGINFNLQLNYAF